MADDLDLAAPKEQNNADSLDDSESKGSNKLLFIMLPILLLVAVGAGLYFSGTLDKMLHGEENAEHAQEESAGEHGEGGTDYSKLGEIENIAFLPITDMIVNLNSDDGQPHLLRLSVQLELANQKDLEIVQAVLPRVKDQFQTYLRELRVQDLRGSKGIYRLQIELLSRVNAAAYPVKVRDVLFDEIIVQ
ncbi:MAG: flagellar basal body-associated FliL family protein [Bdellovibrionales bacterium]